MNASPLGHWALTVSRPSADVTLLTLRVADLAAALLDGPFAQPAGNCHTDPAHELIVMYCATIECFRSVLDAVSSFIRTTDERRFTNDG